MSKAIASSLKLILVGFSLYLMLIQYRTDNMNLVTYWFLVGAYWLFNFLSGIDLNKNKK